MPNTPTIQRDTLTPELFLQLYRSVGWEAPGIDANADHRVWIDVRDEFRVEGLVLRIGERLQTGADDGRCCALSAAYPPASIT